MNTQPQPPRPVVGHHGSTWLLLDSRDRGGIESHVLALAAALRDAGQSPRVVFLADHGPHPLQVALDADGLPWTALAGGAWALLHALRETPPRRVHTHGYKAGILGRIACRALGVPVVSTFHSGDPGRGRVRLYDWLDRVSAPLAPALAVSDELARRVRGPVRRVENFVTPPRLPRNVSGRAIAFVGRLSEEKGPDLFCHLAHRVGDATFAVFGDGPLRTELERDHGWRVTFHGAVDDMPKRWADIGLLVMPSRREGLPMAALEALAHGVPVAAFGVGGLPDLLSDDANGWCVAPGDLEALAAAVRRWQQLGPLSRRVLAVAARASVSRFSPQAQLPTVLAAYREADARAGRHGYATATA